MFCTSVKFTANYANSMQFAHNFHLLTHFTLFQVPAPAENSLKFQRITQILHNSPTTSVNHVKFAPFINQLNIMFQIPAPAENSLKFQRIKQNLLNLPTDPANYANSMHFALKFIHI